MANKDKSKLTKQVNLLAKNLKKLEPSSEDYRKMYNLWQLKNELLKLY